MSPPTPLPHFLITRLLPYLRKSDYQMELFLCVVMTFIQELGEYYTLGEKNIRFVVMVNVLSCARLGLRVQWSPQKKYRLH